MFKVLQNKKINLEKTNNNKKNCTYQSRCIKKDLV